MRVKWQIMQPNYATNFVWYSTKPIKITAIMSYGRILPFKLEMKMQYSWIEKRSAASSSKVKGDVTH